MKCMTETDPTLERGAQMSDCGTYRLTFRRSRRQFRVNFVASRAGEMRGPPAG
jgi:hypothetical protein